jgi:superfamily II DNA or RNA helicase
MREVLVSVQGLSATIHSGVIDNELMATYESKERIYGGPRNGKFVNVVSSEPVFTRSGKYIHCGIGAILYLAKNNPFLSFAFTKIYPERSTLSKIEIPEKITKSDKWLVNGKERYYFHESLKACCKNHSGTVKLPTGSGKTVIELTLGYNQVRELGTGLILVPTNTIKDQFIREAERFDIDLVDYREWLLDREISEPNILISLPTVLHNDVRETLKFSSSEKIVVDYALKKLSMIKWIIGDEVHHAGCETWNGIFMGLPSLGRSHGFSALPVEENSISSVNFSNVSLEDALTISIVGPVIYEKSTKDLKDFLNIPSLINFKYSWPKNKWEDQNTDDWHKLRGLQLENTERLELIANIIRTLIERERNTIIHVGEKRFGTKLLELVDSNKCVTWYGGGDITVSEDVIKLLESENEDV